MMGTWSPRRVEPVVAYAFGKMSSQSTFAIILSNLQAIGFDSR